MARKLNKEQIIPYLRYGLKARTFYGDKNPIDIISGFDFEHGIVSFLNVGSRLVQDVKPALRKFDLLKEIEHHGVKIVPLKVLLKNDEIDCDGWDDLSFELNCKYYDDINEMSYQNANFMFSIHMDVFGLLKKRLAVDYDRAMKNKFTK